MPRDRDDLSIWTNEWFDLGTSMSRRCAIDFAGLARLAWRWSWEVLIVDASHGRMLVVDFNLAQRRSLGAAIGWSEGLAVRYQPLLAGESCGCGGHHRCQLLLHDILMPPFAELCLVEV